MPGVQPKDEGYANCIHPAEALRAWRIMAPLRDTNTATTASVGTVVKGLALTILVCLETVAS